MIKKTCKYCGSENIVADAWATWNPYEEEWELDDVFDTYFCRDCEEMSNIIEEEILEEEP